MEWKWRWKWKKNAIHTQKHNDFISPISHIQVAHKTWGMLISHWLPTLLLSLPLLLSAFNTKSKEWVKGYRMRQKQRRKNIENSIFFWHLVLVLGLGLTLTMCLCIAWAFTHVVRIQLQSTSMYFCKVRGRCLIQLIWLWSFSSHKCTSLAPPFSPFFHQPLVIS